MQETSVEILSQKTIDDLKAKLKKQLKPLVDAHTAKWSKPTDSYDEEALLDSFAEDVLFYGSKFNELPDVEHVTQFGGEGQGDDYWAVFKYQGTPFKISGSYSSWEGGEIEVWDWKQVKPVQVLTTEWVAL